MEVGPASQKGSGVDLTYCFGDLQVSVEIAFCVGQ
jgi:hypothetical protein